eukprot:11170851-Lingulodinium_polyedra.AAC.1
MRTCTMLPRCWDAIAQAAPGVEEEFRSERQSKMGARARQRRVGCCAISVPAVFVLAGRGPAKA